MSERLAPAHPREEFPANVKREAWDRCMGYCEGCGRQLKPGGYRYDHTIPTRRGGPPTLDNCKVLCRDGPTSCDWIKTHTEDLPGIAAIKRYGKNRLPLDIDRPERKPSKIKSPGFARVHRPMKGRSTFESRKKS